MQFFPAIFRPEQAVMAVGAGEEGDIFDNFATSDTPDAVLGYQTRSLYPDILEPDMDSGLFLQYHADNCGVREVHHAVPRQEPLTCSQYG